MKQPPVSVIVPVFNRARLLHGLHEHLLKQTLDGIEIVFVDDGSSDGSAGMLDEFARNDGRTLVLHQSNGGTGAARNAGISAARGEYIAFLDSDDRFASDDTLELLYRAAVENGAAVCGGGLQRRYRGELVHDEHPSWSPELALSDAQSQPKDLGKRAEGYDDTYMRFGRNGVFRYRDYQYDFGFYRFIYDRNFLVANSLRFPGRRYCEDPEFFIRAMIAAESFYAVDRPVYELTIGDHGRAVSAQAMHETIAGLKANLLLSKEHDLALLHWITATARMDMLRDIDFAAKSDPSIEAEFIEMMDCIDWDLIEPYGDMPFNAPLHQINALHTNGVIGASDKLRRLRRLARYKLRDATTSHPLRG
ncbi:glycosyltransferase family 2 protein [Curtanaerobium respiraculi]|uniref:glycosyltransferase family 2 protein n=1 Tax=Curtanaerobium respiraculi TaxID=2949669 RepID=UPI0024B389D0|nr:glycosyltransferase family 2 protein [Curtanaerobium respiraculi]